MESPPSLMQIIIDVLALQNPDILSIKNMVDMLSVKRHIKTRLYSLATDRVRLLSKLIRAQNPEVECNSFNVAKRCGSQAYHETI